MEISETAPVRRIEAAAQIVPTLDLVHGLISDDLFEDRRRRLPVDPPENEEAAVEPDLQQILQIGIDGREARRPPWAVRSSS